MNTESFELDFENPTVYQGNSGLGPKYYRSLEKDALSLIHEELSSDPNIDTIEELEEKVLDGLNYHVETLVTYYSDSMKIIEEYENHEFAQEIEDFGRTYTINEFWEHVTGYAYSIAESVIKGYLNTIFEAIKEDFTILYSICQEKEQIQTIYNNFS